MIKFPTKNIYIENSDNCKEVFSFRDLQSMIMKSCADAGVQEDWIAEDIALAIEYSLSNSDNDTYSLSEINACVVKVLGETGYSNVAEQFEKGLKERIPQIEINEENIQNIIFKFVDLPENKREIIQEKILESLNVLGIKSSSHTLITELAKHYNNSFFRDINTEIKKSGKTEETSFIISQETIYNKLDKKSQKFIDLGFIQITGISKLFKAIKIGLRLSQFANYAQLDTPIIEMNFNQNFTELINETNKIVSVINSLIGEEGHPFCLNINDMDIFAENHLGISFETNKAECYKIMDSFRDLFILEPVIRLLNK